MASAKLWKPSVFKSKSASSFNFPSAAILPNKIAHLGGHTHVYYLYCRGSPVL